MNPSVMRKCSPITGFSLPTCAVRHSLWVSPTLPATQPWPGQRNDITSQHSLSHRHGLGSCRFLTRQTGEEAPRFICEETEAQRGQGATELGPADPIPEALVPIYVSYN